jgi:hypothetical protein
MPGNQSKEDFANHKEVLDNDTAEDSLAAPHDLYGQNKGGLENTNLNN